MIIEVLARYRHDEELDLKEGETREVPPELGFWLCENGFAKDPARLYPTGYWRPSKSIRIKPKDLTSWPS